MNTTKKPDKKFKVNIKRATRKLEKVAKFTTDLDSTIYNLKLWARHVNAKTIDESKLTIKEEFAIRDLKNTADELESYLEMGKQLNSRLKKLEKTMRKIDEKYDSNGIVF